MISTRRTKIPTPQSIGPAKYHVQNFWQLGDVGLYPAFCRALESAKQAGGGWVVTDKTIDLPDGAVIEGGGNTGIAHGEWFL